MEFKRCTRCNKMKPVSEFHKSHRDGYVSKCKSCRSYLHKNIQPSTKTKSKCLVCGAEFIKYNTLSKYCNYKCTSEARIKNRILKNGLFKCKECGKEFKAYNNTSKYCSKECAYKHSKQTRIGKGNPSYRNGNYIKKAKKTRTQINESIFDKNKKEIISDMINDVGYKYCQHCGTSNSKKFESHHIIFRSEKPLHRHLHSKPNIFHVCIICHNKFHKNKGLRNQIVEDRKLYLLFGDDVRNKEFKKAPG